MVHMMDLFARRMMTLIFRRTELWWSVSKGYQANVMKRADADRTPGGPRRTGVALT